MNRLCPFSLHKAGPENRVTTICQCSFTSEMYETNYGGTF